MNPLMNRLRKFVGLLGAALSLGLFTALPVRAEGRTPLDRLSVPEAVTIQASLSEVGFLTAEIMKGYGETDLSVGVLGIQGDLADPGKKRWDFGSNLRGKARSARPVFTPTVLPVTAEIMKLKHSPFRSPDSNTFNLTFFDIPSLDRSSLLSWGQAGS